MVTRKTCMRCKGNKWIKVSLSKGGSDFRKCPECGGTGIRVVIESH